MADNAADVASVPTVEPLVYDHGGQMKNGLVFL